MAAVLLLAVSPAQADYRTLGYQYLSPLPGAEYCSPQTRFVLVRLKDVSPTDVTNLATTFITVTGANSGNHAGQARVASDGRTIVFTMNGQFGVNAGLGLQIGLGETLSLQGEVRAFAFKERTLTWSALGVPANVVEQALQQELLARLEPISFDPLLWSATAGISLRF